MSIVMDPEKQKSRILEALLNQQKRIQDNMRSTDRIEYIKVEPNGYVRRAHLPVGRGFGDGSSLYWENQGWETVSNFEARTHKEAVEVERQAAMQKQLDEARAETEKAKAELAAAKVELKADKKKA